MGTVPRNGPPPLPNGRNRSPSLALRTARSGPRYGAGFGRPGPRSRVGVVHLAFRRLAFDQRLRLPEEGRALRVVNPGQVLHALAQLRLKVRNSRPLIASQTRAVPS